MAQNVISITLYLAKSKLYPQIQRKDAINHIYVSYRPVVQVAYIYRLMLMITAYRQKPPPPVQKAPFTGKYDTRAQP